MYRALRYFVVVYGRRGVVVLLFVYGESVHKTGYLVSRL